MAQGVREKLAANILFGDGRKHFLAVGGPPVTSSVIHTGMRVTHCTTSFCSTERKQERLLLTSLKSSLSLFIFLVSHRGNFFLSNNNDFPFGSVELIISRYTEGFLRVIFGCNIRSMHVSSFHCLLFFFLSFAMMHS